MMSARIDAPKSAIPEQLPPGSEVKQTIKCGNSLLFFFQRSIDKLCGVLIKGDDASEEDISTKMQSLINSYGPVDLILCPPKFDGLREKFLSQGSVELKTLEGRSVTVQKVEAAHQPTTSRRADSPYLALQPEPRSYGAQFASNRAQFAQIQSQIAALERIVQLEKAIQDQIAKGKQHVDDLCFRGQTYPNERAQAYTILETGSVEDIEKLNFGKYRKEQETSIKNAIKGEFILNRKELEKELKDEKAKLFKPETNTHQVSSLDAEIARSRLQEQHAPWDQSLAHLEVLAGLWNKDTAQIVLRQARLGNQLVEKLRVLQSRLAQMNEMSKQTGLFPAALSIGASVATLEPILACVALSASICAIVGSSGTEMLPPLTQQIFFQVMKQGLVPLIQDVHLSLSDGQSRLADQTDEQTTALLQAMNLCQRELIDLLARLKRETNQHFDAKRFEDFVSAARKNGRVYREEKLADAVAFIKGTRTPPDDWLQRYIESTDAALDHSKTSDAHGFIGSKSPSMECVAQSGVSLFSTGSIHHALFGDQLFPSELSLLDAACHTYVCLIRALLQDKQMVKTKDTTALGLLSEKLLAGVESQSNIFSKMEPTLNLLLESHQAFMRLLQNNIHSTKASTQDAARQWVRDNREAILEATVGQEMFALSKLVYGPMNLTPYNDELQATINGRVNLNCVSCPVGIIDRLFDYWTKTASIMNKRVCELSMARNLTDRIHTDEELWVPGAYHNAKATLKRRIWSDSKGFQSAVTVTAMSLIPYAFIFNQMDEVNVIDNPPVPPKNPLLDCTVLFQVIEPWGGNLKTEFNQDSRLQSEDLQRIPSVDEASGAQRKNLMAGVLDLLEGANLPEDHPLRKYSERYEVCLPLQKGSTPLPLPKTLMAYMQQALCPDLEKMALMGSRIDLRYDFEKSRLGNVYHLNLHAVYNESAVPFQSRCVFEVDAATVESYAKQMQQGTSPNITEFLYCALFAGDYEGEGLPGNKTYFNEKKGIVAPCLTPFPGLFSILEKSPHLCFSFNSQKYTHDAMTGKFFKVGQTQVNPQNYMAVQKRMRERAAAIENSPECQTFKQNYTLFQTLAQLVSADNPNEVREKLRNFARIIPPGEMGWLEQAYYYEPPLEEDCGLLLTELGNKPSLAEQRLKKYATQLTEIRSALQRIENGELFSLEEQNRWVAYKLGLNDPSKLVANLEEDAKEA